MQMSIQEYLREEVIQVMTATVGEPWCTSEYEQSMQNVTKGLKHISGKIKYALRKEVEN